MLAAANRVYDNMFFQDMSRGAAYAASVVVPLVLEWVSPASVLDVGCGTGGWLDCFRKCGLEDVLGIDGPWVRDSELLIPEFFQQVDLSAPFALGRVFDLVVCLEVAEHLPAECAETLISSLARHGNVVLFSAAAPYQGGTHHVNEQWLSYWVEKWAEHGYVGVDPLRRRIWERLGLHETWIYAQNAVFFVKEEALPNYPKLHDEYKYQCGPPLSLVHPRMFSQHVPPENCVTLRQVILGLPGILARCVRHRIWKYKQGQGK